MQNYQQYLSTSSHQQLSRPATSIQPHLPAVLAYGETTTGGSSGSCTLPAPGYISIKPPTSLVYQIHPENFSYGFNSSGKLIGANQEIPYPFSNTKYYTLPFPRTVDWYTTEVLGNTSLNEVMKKKHPCSGNETSSTQTETAEYFTADNDEGYKKWIAKKTQEQKSQAEKQAQIRVVPREVKTLPGHANPTTTETSNEVYGQYIDLRPKYPAVYPLPAKIPQQPMQVLVKFRPSNMSDHTPIPDHAFAVDPREMMNKGGCYTRGIHGSVYTPQTSDPQSKTAFTFRQSQVFQGRTVGERSKGFTWPMYAPTGLELNRPIPRCVSVLAGIDGKKKFRALVPARAVPYIYNRYMSYTVVPNQDPNTEQNPAKHQQKQMCAPFTPYKHTNPLSDPCNTKFINPQLLHPLSLELGQPPSS